MKPYPHCICGIALVLSALFLNSCNPAGNRPQDTPVPGLIDQTASDSSIRPQDDFFSYANGTWIKNTEIPPSQFGWGAFMSLRDQSITDIHSILDSLSHVSVLPKNTPAQRVADLYASIMDSATIESKGLTPLKGDFERINNIKNVPGLLDEVASEFSKGESNQTFFDLQVSADDRNSLINAAHFYQGGLGLSSKDYYFNKDTSIQKIRDAYKAYMTAIFTLTGAAPEVAAQMAVGVFAAETELAKVSRNNVELRDPIANYHKMSVSEASKLTSDIDWSDFLGKLHIQTDTVILGEPEFFTGMARALKSVSLDQWKAYLIFHLVDHYNPVLDHHVVDAQFAFLKAFSGQKEIKPRWKRASTLVDTYLGDDLGQLYVKKYFPPQAKERIGQLVDNLQATFAARIQNLDWMSDSTKKKALVKINAVVKKVGYPDTWKDYAGVVIDKSDAVGNIRNCAQYEYMRNARKVGHPVDRNEWFMTPSTVNAYYDATANNINFPAGILHPLFFFPDGDDALNYGGIGMVIGHEMTHGFDDQGRLYDENGNLHGWWTPEDSTRFVQKANLIVHQYNGYIAVDTFHINGQLTLGENIADNGGLAIAYAAFKNTPEGKDTSLRIDGMSPDQRFFRAFAQSWKTKMRPEVERVFTISDPHSSKRFRVNGPLANLDAFYQAYDVKPGDMMYRPDSLRAKIW
jgi:putative endopeptidase